MTSEDALQIWRDSRSKDSQWRRLESGSKLEEAFQWTTADRNILEDKSSQPARKTEAAEKVLGTCELLEQILLLCHPRDLHRFQRVSTLWRDVTLASKSMKQAMWRSDTAMQLTPMPPSTTTRDLQEYSVAGMSINPCLKIETEVFGPAMMEYTCFASVDVLLVFEMLRTRPHFLIFQSRPFQIRRSAPSLASWRSMLLTSPPVRTVEVIERESALFPPVPTRRPTYGRYPIPPTPRDPCLRTLFNPTGITFGDLYDGIQSNILGLPWGTSISYRLYLQGDPSECQRILTTGKEMARRQSESPFDATDIL